MRRLARNAAALSRAPWLLGGVVEIPDVMQQHEPAAGASAAERDHHRRVPRLRAQEAATFIVGRL
jgi:hypothetical protein